MIRECESFNDGILKNGLRNGILNIYYYIMTQFIKYDALDETPWKRTEEFLDYNE